MKKYSFLLILSFFAALSVSAQKMITVEDIYQNGVFRQESVYNVNWMNDGKYYSALEDNQIRKIDVTSGES
jgi:dipeptidyl-peptidase-4